MKTGYTEPLSYSFHPQQTSKVCVTTQIIEIKELSLRDVK